MTHLSVIIPIAGAAADLKRVNDGYIAALETMGRAYEIVYVLEEFSGELDPYPSELERSHSNTRIIWIKHRFDSAAALTAGLAETSGDLILLLPCYAQVSARDLWKVVAALTEADVAVAERDRQDDSLVNRFKSWIYNQLARRVSDTGISDVSCEVRALRRPVFHELTLYGGLARFLPEQAHRLGFKVTGVRVAQARSDRRTQIQSFTNYARRLLDLLSAVLLLRFTMKPIRFFGAIGLALGILGFGMLGYAIAEPFFFDGERAGRYAAVAGALTLMLALQTIAIGLVGETVVFSRWKKSSPYRIQETTSSTEVLQPPMSPNNQQAS